jgi:hypothetical protein
MGETHLFRSNNFFELLNHRLRIFEILQSCDSSSQLPRKRLPQHRLRQPLTSPARRHNLLIERIRTLKQQTDTPNDLVLFGKGGEWDRCRSNIIKIEVSSCRI